VCFTLLFQRCLLSVKLQIKCKPAHYESFDEKADSMHRRVGGELRYQRHPWSVCSAHDLTQHCSYSNLSNSIALASAIISILTSTYVSKSTNLIKLKAKKNKFKLAGDAENRRTIDNGIMQKTKRISISFFCWVFWEISTEHWVRRNINSVSRDEELSKLWTRSWLQDGF